MNVFAITNSAVGNVVKSVCRPIGNLTTSGLGFYITGSPNIFAGGDYAAVNSGGATKNMFHVISSGGIVDTQAEITRASSDTLPEIKIDVQGRFIITVIDSNYDTITLAHSGSYDATKKIADCQLENGDVLWLDGKQYSVNVWSNKAQISDTSNTYLLTSGYNFFSNGGSHTSKAKPLDLSPYVNLPLDEDSLINTIVNDEVFTTSVTNIAELAAEAEVQSTIDDAVHDAVVEVKKEINDLYVSC